MVVMRIARWLLPAKGPLRGLVLTVAAFVGSVAFGVVMLFLSQAFDASSQFKTAALWSPIAVCAVALIAAISHTPWIPKHDIIDLLVRVVVGVALFFFFFPMFGVWGMGGVSAGNRAKEQLREIRGGAR